MSSPSASGEQRVDVIVVGAGPAGLSAALLLGRARRSVVVFDDGTPRNRVSRASHGFLSRDGTSPRELLRISREQLACYPSVRLEQVRVVDAKQCEGGGFEVVTASGARWRARKLVLATGLVDQLPPVRGFEELYGRGVYSCPYCDGWELREQPLAVYGQCDARGGELALELTVWSRDVVLCTDGGSTLSQACSGRLERHGVRVRHDRISHVEGDESAEPSLRVVVFEHGPPLERRALFVHSNPREASDLALRAGCEAWSPTNIGVKRHGRAGPAGLFVIGDASRDVLQIAVAVGEGNEAAITVNCELMREDLR